MIEINMLHPKPKIIQVGFYHWFLIDLPRMPRVLEIQLKKSYSGDSKYYLKKVFQPKDN